MRSAARQRLIGWRNEMTMNKSEKYRRASLAQLTPEQLATARRNYQYCARRFPEEQGKIAAMIEDRGLGDHREVLEHYARNKSPISEYELGLIGLYGDTSYQEIGRAHV